MARKGLIGAVRQGCKSVRVLCLKGQNGWLTDSNALGLISLFQFCYQIDDTEYGADDTLVVDAHLRSFKLAEGKARPIPQMSFGSRKPTKGDKEVKSDKTRNRDDANSSADPYVTFDDVQLIPRHKGHTHE